MSEVMTRAHAVKLAAVEAVPRGPGGHPAGPVESLEWCYPDCPEGCGETNGDGDSLWCETCGATWEKDGTGGHRDAVERADVAS